MLHLDRRWRLMRGFRGCLFRSSRARSDAALPTVEAYLVDRGVIYCRLRVCVANVGDIHVAHGSVVVEMLTLPMSALVTLAEIAETIVDAAVETYGCAPISGIPRIAAITRSPISGRPEHAR